MQETYETQVPSLGREDPLEEGIVTHCTILTWRILTDTGAWRATVHWVTQSQTRLKQLSAHTHTVKIIFLLHELIPLLLWNIPLYPWLHFLILKSTLCVINIVILAFFSLVFVCMVYHFLSFLLIFSFNLCLYM